MGYALFADGVVHATDDIGGPGAPVVALEADITFVDVFLESLADAA